MVNRQKFMLDFSENEFITIILGEGSKMEKITRGLRASGRAIKGIGILARLLWTVYFDKPKSDEEFRSVSHKFYNDLKDLFGIKIVFNKASAPIEDRKLTWYIANHMSIADFIILGSVLRSGTFAGKHLNLPRDMLRISKYIGIPRVDKEHPDFKKNNQKTMGSIMNNFNGGQSTIMFPEGTTTDGSHVALFRAGLLNALYGEKGLDENGNDVTLQAEVWLQPIAIKVKAVEGKDVDMRPELRHFYSHYTSDNTLKRIWTRLATESITIELTVFPPMNPKNYADGKQLANAASDIIRAEVAPNQKIVEKAKIPGVAERGEQRSKPPKPGGGYY